MKQIRVMIRANLVSLKRRLAIAFSMALSVALAVCVLVGFLSMASGFESVLKNSGSDTVAVVLGGGTNQEFGSDIPSEAIRALQATRADIGVDRNRTGNIILSQELVQPVIAELGENGVQRTLSLRGMSKDGAQLRDKATISEGRMFSSGAREIAVGCQLAADLPELAVGNTVRLGTVNWKIVGHYEAAGSVFESEIWSGLDAVRGAFDRQGHVQTLRMRLTDPAALLQLQTALEGLTNATPLTAMTEADLYKGQSRRTVDLIRYFGWPIAILMAFGATAGAVNTMMSSVSDRTVEIATVRALGFSRLSAFTATWVESVLIASIGTALGLAVSWAVFNGWQASTLGANNTHMAFKLEVSQSVIQTVAIFGVTIGIIGGVLPALSATRIPLIAALRTQG